MTGRLSLRDLRRWATLARLGGHLPGAGPETHAAGRRGNLLEALAELEAQEDVNKILKYFSYEHFYVIYCKFWELDSDHNFLLSQEDLLRYGNHALTYRIVDRIFSQARASGVGPLCSPARPCAAPAWRHHCSPPASSASRAARVALSSRQLASSGVPLPAGRPSEARQGLLRRRRAPLPAGWRARWATRTLCGSS